MLHQNLIGYGAGGALPGAYTINQSCLFNDDDSANLQLSLGGDLDMTQFVIAWWMKLGVPKAVKIFSADADANNRFHIVIQGSNNDFAIAQYTGGVTKCDVKFEGTELRDPSAWQFYQAVFDTPNASAALRVRMWQGQTELAQTRDTACVQSEPMFWGDATYTQQISGRRYDTSQYFDGYLAEVMHKDATVYTDTSNFIEVDDNGQIIPKNPSILSLTDYFKFEDSSNLGSNSGSQGDWTENGLAAADQVLDSPTDSGTTIGNYSTGSSIYTAPSGYASEVTWSEGNTKVVIAISSGDVFIPLTTTPILTGKWHIEFVMTTLSSGHHRLGLTPTLSTFDPSGSGHWNWFLKPSSGNGMTQLGGVEQSGSLTVVTAGQRVAVDIDLDNGTIAGSFNGSNIFTDSSMTLATGPYTLFFTNNGTTISNINAGQFGFDDTPATGHLPICTANLAAPAILDPSAHFNVVGYTGTGSARDVTFGGNTELTADYIAIKNISTNDEWKLVDRIRGVTKEMNWDDNTAESTDSNGLDDLSVTDGFGLGSGAGGYNDSTENFLAFGWAADGTTGSSNTNGTITSTVSANTTAGFSFGTYTGTNSTATVGHGLSSAPDLVVVKCRDATNNHWAVYHVSNTAAPETDVLFISLPNVTSDDANYWNDTAPTSTVFSIGIEGATGTADDFIFSAWHAIAGFSAFGGYTGNGNADGPFLSLGFRPAFLWIKRVSGAAGGWFLFDKVQAPYNPTADVLYFHDPTSRQENACDILSNGFKVRNTAGDVNVNSTPYIYAAWAEFPFGGSGVAQARAR